MRKITWLIIILTLIIWLAIARYWTGTGSAKLQPNTPSSQSTIPVETPVITPTPEILPATSAATLLSTPSSEIKY